MLPKVLEDPLLEILFVVPLLVPPEIAAVGGEGPRDLDLLRDRPARRLLDDGRCGGAAAHEEPGRDDNTQAKAAHAGLLLYQGRLEYDASVHYPGCPPQQCRQRLGHLGRLPELAQEIDEAPEGANQVSFVTAERVLYDTRPVVVSRSPAENRGHEAGGDADGHWQVVMTLDLEHGVGHRLQLLELALELRALLQEDARDRRIPRARLLDETRAEGRGLGERRVLEDAAVHHLRDKELVIVPEAGDELPLGQELVVLDGAEALEHGHHAAELLPVGVADGVEHLALLPEAAFERLDPFPLMVALALAAPGTAMALDGGQLGLGSPAPLPLDELRDREPLELLGEALRSPLPVARQVERRGLPEDPLDVPFFHLDGHTVRQKHGHQHAVAATVDAADEPEGGAALPPHQRQSPRLGGGGRARAAPGLSARHALLLELGARHSITADAREVAAGRLEAPAVRHGHLEARDLGFEAADLLEVLVLPERRLDRPPDGRHVLSRRQQQRDRAVAELELAQDRLGRAVHHTHHVLEAVADVEGHDALALGVDAAAARPARHLGELVVSERAEAAVRALGQGLQHDALGGHVDAERHGLGGEDHLAEPALEEELDEALHRGQHS